MKILVSAFEPFGGGTQNSSQLVLKEIEKNSPSSVQLKLIFDVPVVFDEAYAHLRSPIQQFQPDAIVALGQAEGRPCVTIESAAYNWMDTTGADNKGYSPQKQKIDPHAQDLWRTSLTAQKLVRAVNAAGLSCEISLTPGSFVCNRLMFDLLRFEPQIPSGFIHLPLVDSQKKSPTDRSVPLMQLHKAVYVVLEAMSQR